LAGQPRRSAGASSADAVDVRAAKHALTSGNAPSRKRRWALSVAATVCAGLVLSASSAVGQSATGTPVAASPTIARDVDTLSRGSIDREALAEAEATSAEPNSTLTPAPTVYYVTTAAYLRATPSTTGTVVTTLAAGTPVTANGGDADGWQPVATPTASGFVKDSLLTTTAPSKTVSSKAAAGSAYPACASGSAVESGLVAHAILVHRAVCSTFPDITSYGGIRGDGSEHASGKALDIMTSGTRGTEIAAWLQANYSKLGIVEIIYQQRIWTTQRASEGWRAMPDRGSATANHFDHIHVLVS